MKYSCTLNAAYNDKSNLVCISNTLVCLIYSSLEGLNCLSKSRLSLGNTRITVVSTLNVCICKSDKASLLRKSLCSLDLLKNLTFRLGDFLEEYPEYQEYIGEKVPSWNDTLIENAEYVKDFILRITFRNGEVKQINIKPYIFKNPKVFQQMIDNSNIISQLQYDSVEVFWNDLMGIEAHTLYNMAEKLEK